MKHVVFTVLLVGGWIGQSLAAPSTILPSPILTEQFNTASPTVNFVNGAQLGEPGSGVSQGPEDKSYQGTGPDAGAIITTAIPTNLPTGTLTCWIKKEGEIAPAESICSIQGLYLYRDKAWTFRSPDSTGFSTFHTPKPSNDWQFFAVTWSPTEIITYHGDKNGTEPGKSRVIPGESVVTRGAVIVGNRDLKGEPKERGFQGAIDNVRIFSEALTPEQIDSIREADTIGNPIK